MLIYKSSLTAYLIHCVSKTPPYVLNNSAKNEPILIIFGVQNQEKISHQIIRNSPRRPPHLNKFAALTCEKQLI